MNVFDGICSTNIQLAERAKAIATDYKTLYVWGCFGAPMTIANKLRYCNNHPSNADEECKQLIHKATADTYGFDCSGLVKGILWGWKGSKSNYGGALYSSNDIPDYTADKLISNCIGVSTDFSDIEIGELVWMTGHCGIYIGNGLVVEATPKWNNCVQITSCNKTIDGYKRRNWTSHGKLPWISYKHVEKHHTIDETDRAKIIEKFGELLDLVVAALECKTDN